MKDIYAYNESDGNKNLDMIEYSQELKKSIEDRNLEMLTPEEIYINSERVQEGNLVKPYTDYMGILVVVGNTYDDNNSEKICQFIPSMYINNFHNFEFNFSFTASGTSYDRRVWINFNSTTSYKKNAGPSDYVVRAIYGIGKIK